MIEWLVGFRIDDVNGIETHTDVVSVEADTHRSSGIETFGLCRNLNNGCPFRLAEADLIGGDGISQLKFCKKLGKSGGVDTDVPVNGYAIEIITRGKDFFVNMADAIKIRP